MLISRINFSNTSYKNKVIIKNFISIGIVLLGIASLTLSICMKMGIINSINDFSNGFYTGTGGGLIGAGIATIIKNVILLRNEEKLKKAEIESNDERNKLIGQKTLSISAIIGFFIIYICLIISGFYNEVVFSTLLCCLGGIGLIAFVVYIILNKIM